VVRTAAAARVDAVICTVAEEMPALAGAVPDLSGVGVAIWLPSIDAVHDCIDKARFAAVVASAGIAAPTTRAGSADGVPGPWIVKPRFGRGSRSVFAVDDDVDLRDAIRRTPDPVVQTRCSGREFTVDALVERDGTVVGLVPRWRLETKAGISTKGETFSDDRVDALVRATVAAIGLEGACNVQGFADDAGVQVVEVNPRFSGGLPLSLAAGADLVGEFLRGTLGRPLRPERLVHRDGVVMTRHLAEVFLEPSACGPGGP
jgi:carbamoyl-phosphate synthase large subunit